MEMARIIVVWTMLLISVSGNGALGAPSFSAMFVFGDSLVDNGNNNNLNTLAKANFVPYGIDFPQGPTGRFCNGKTIIDFLGEVLGLPLLPAFADAVMHDDQNISRGVNYASAAAGIMDETGQNLGERISFSKQVLNFETTRKQLKSQMGDKELSQHLANSLAVVIHGSNDYLNNYLFPDNYTNSIAYNPQNYAELLIKIYKRQILVLHGLGLRKFLLAGIGPLGCIPSQLAIGLVPSGQCRNAVNDMVVIFNALLKSLVDELNAEYTSSIFVYGNTFGIFNEIMNSSKTYGFTVTDSGCCGVGRSLGEIPCLPMFSPCSNRDQYVFWDAFHPTEAMNKIIAHRSFHGPPFDCYPVNVKHMAQI